METTIKTDFLQKYDIEEILRIQVESNLDRWLLQDYFEEIKREDSLSFTAKKDEHTIGFIIARLITTNSIDVDHINNNLEIESKSEIEIYNLAVDKHHRKQGIGTLLIKCLVQAAVAKNHNTSIWLEVRESNMAARSFYKKNKFNEIYRRKNFYSHPQEDALVMKLDSSTIELNK